VRIWVPPYWVRRVFHLLWPPTVVVLTVVLLPFYVVGAVFAILPGRRRLLRVVSFALAYLWTDLGMLLGCWWLWLWQPLPSRDVTVWRERHTALLRLALRVLAKASRSMVGFRVFIDAGPLPPAHRPLVILGRHAGPGDSFTLVNLILTTFRRRPKVVLKAAMQWDPGIDLLLNRLDCYFLPSMTGAGDDRVEHVARLANSLVADEALLIFPEGGNWTPKRHQRAVRYLLRTGQYERAKEAEDEEHVLPPRPGGVVAALSARPDLDVVVLAHAGLDLLVSPADIWHAIPVVHQPMAIHWWVAESSTIPADRSGILAWMDDIWSEVDAWVEAELKQAVTPTPPMP
jgi:1-acyl-sn-glycerol-3-phosphate acyltransferase